MEGHLDRVGQLKSSPVAYAKRAEQEKLSASHAALRQQLHGVEERTATLRQRCTAAGARATSVLNAFMVKRENYRARMRLGMSEPNLALDECRRLAVFPVALVANGVVNVENVSHCRMNADGSVILPDGQTVYPDALTKAEANAKETKAAAELARLRRDQEQLQDELSQLRSAQTSGSRPIFVTNEVQTVIEKPVPAPAPPPVTNKVIQIVTNIQKVLVRVTNTVFVEKTVPALTPSPVTKRQVEQSNNKTATVPPAASKHVRGRPSGRPTVSVWVMGVAGTVVMAALILAWRWRRKASELQLDLPLEDAPVSRRLSPWRGACRPLKQTLEQRLLPARALRMPGAGDEGERPQKSVEPGLGFVV
jgi:hypothetical protein